MATRATVIIAGIEAAIEASTLDSKAHTGDVFRKLEASDDAQIMTADRVFSVQPTSLPMRDTQFIGATTPGMANFQAQISVGYARGSDSAVIDRILQDAERIMYALENYAGTVNTDVAQLEQTSTTISPYDAGLVLEFDLDITYRIDLS